MRQATDQPKTRRRANVREAAEVLGITVEAVRGRIKRDTIPHGKDDNGGVYVWLNADQADQPQPDGDHQNDQTGDRSELMAALKDQIAILTVALESEREANRENRRIIAGLTQRIPEIAAPQTHQEPAGDPAPGGEGYNAPTNDASPQRPPEESQYDHHGNERRPWWRRIFD